MLSLPGRLAVVILYLIYSHVALAEVPAEQREFRSLDEQVQSLKGDVISINRELMLLQEKLVYPSNTQVSVFVSLEAGKHFSLDSLELKLGNRTVQKHVYTYRELEAMRNSGVQRLHTQNLANGKHQLTVNIAGHTASNSTYKKTASFTLVKETGPRLVEIKVMGSGPQIKLVNWQ